MNKIKLLYDVTRAMKNLEKFDGVLQIHVRKGQEEVFALRNKFETTEAGKTKTMVSSTLNLDGGHVTRESTTEFDFPGHCCHGSGMVRRLFHRHHAPNGCCGIKGIFSRLSHVFGILSSLKLEEKENGAAVVSLSLSDVPEELSALLLKKMQGKNDCLLHHGILKEHHTVEAMNGTLMMTVNKERVIERITIDLDSTALDENNGRHILAATAEVQFA